MDDIPPALDVGGVADAIVPSSLDISGKCINSKVHRGL